MLNLVFPVGSHHGWGVCGRHLYLELSRLTPTALISDPVDPKEQTSELEGARLAAALVDKTRLAADGRTLAGVVVQPIDNQTFGPWEPAIRGQKNVGYAFYEETELTPEQAARARDSFDLVLAGSTWCQEILRRGGLSGARTLVQGVNRRWFNSIDNQKKSLTDRFVVFSGGKFELRKGQDLVIKAFAVLASRHADAILAASWFNPWPQSMATMAASPHLAFAMQGDYLATVRAAMAAAGLDHRRALILPPRPHPLMAEIYKESDLGVFPNRCEGGTNLVMMEYLACGKPAIVSPATGHADIVRPDNAILLSRLGRLPLTRDGRTVAVWDEPDLDELVEKLEWAYQHRDELKAIGEAAGRHLERFTWEAAARRLMSMVRGL